MLVAGLAGSVHAQDATPIRIAYPAGMNGEIPVVADKAGLARKNGLAAEYNFFQNGPPMMEALASGSVDAVVSSYQPLTTYLLKQPGTVTVVANLGNSSYSLMVARDTAAASLADLKGKRIALSYGSDSHLDLLRAIRKLGLNPASDFNLINLQPSDLQLVLSQGLAEAIVIRQPQVQRLQEQGARTLQTWPHHYLVVVRNDYLAKYPAARQKLEATLRDSVAFVANNGEQASIWFGERLRQDPRIVRELATQNPIFKGVKVADDAHIEFGKTHVQWINDWFVAAYDNGLIKARVEPLKH
jgi:ABC-type nitrate/sulfonate/bicarbonate transport system substrate-binding protein